MLNTRVNQTNVNAWVTNMQTGRSGGVRHSKVIEIQRPKVQNAIWMSLSQSKKNRFSFLHRNSNWSARTHGCRPVDYSTITDDANTTHFVVSWYETVPKKESYVTVQWLLLISGTPSLTTVDGIFDKRTEGWASQNCLSCRNRQKKARDRQNHWKCFSRQSLSHSLSWPNILLLSFKVFRSAKLTSQK